MRYRIFQKIIETESFTLAAESLHLTQSAVSHAVAALEKEMGFSLFHRSKGAVRPTEDGRSLIPYVDALVAAEDRLLNQVHAVNQLESGKLRVGSFASASTRILPEIFKAFDERYPNIAIDFFDGGYEMIKEQLLQERIDVGFLLDTHLDERLTAIPYFMDEVVAVIPRHQDGALAEINATAPEGFPLEMLAHYPLIMPDNAQDTYLDQLFQSYRVRPQIKYRFQLMSTVFAMVEVGLGITLVAESALTKTAYAVERLPLNPRVYRHIHLVTTHRQLASPVVQAFWQVAQQVQASKVSLFW